MAALHVQLFGKLRMWREPRFPLEIEGDKARELWCYLLLHHDHPQPREALATLLWPESSPVRAKRNLRQTLWQLQAALQTTEAAASHQLSLLQADRQWIWINGDADYWLDVVAFESAFREVRGVAADALDAARSAAVVEAVELYTGELLEGCYQEWCLLERERLARMFRAMLDKLMTYCAISGDYEAGLGYGERLLAEDPARERVHRGMMRLYYLRGDRTEALRQYERCVAVLARELGIQPSRRTVDLREQLRADSLDHDGLLLDGPADSPWNLPTGPTPGSGSLRQILGQLTRLRQDLADAQTQLQDQIQTVVPSGKVR